MDIVLGALAVVLTGPIWVPWALRMHFRWLDAKEQHRMEATREAFAEAHRRVREKGS